MRSRRTYPRDFVKRSRLPLGCSSHLTCRFTPIGVRHTRIRLKHTHIGLRHTCISVKHSRTSKFSTPHPTASERRGHDLKEFKHFYLNAKARIWPWRPHMCHVRSTADLRSAPEARCSPLGNALTDYPQVETLHARYKSATFRPKTNPPSSARPPPNQPLTGTGVPL